MDMCKEINNYTGNLIDQEDTPCDREEAFFPTSFKTDETHEETEKVALWKDKVLKNCALWVEQIRHIPVIPEIKEEPDLYSFYEQLCVLRNEFRKNSRRSHETFSEFGEHLEEFQHVLNTLTQRLDMLDRVDAKTSAPQRLFLHIVEVYERFRRFGEKLKEMEIFSRSGDKTPGPGLLERIKSIYAAKGVSRNDISDSIVEGYFMTLSRFEEFLAGEGVLRIDATGTSFDPSIMIAVGTIDGDNSLADTVYEEIEGGYLYGENVLKLAKVIVIKGKGN